MASQASRLAAVYSFKGPGSSASAWSGRPAVHSAGETIRAAYEAGRAVGGKSG